MKKIHFQLSLVDKNIGKILDALEETGELDNTLIIFTTDHGEMLGDHGLFFKGQFFYDPCVKVPLLMRWPGKVKSGTIEGNMSKEEIATNLSLAIKAIKNN